MCGIAGAIRESRALHESPLPGDGAITAVVQAMSDAERHRGPDGFGRWESPGREVVFAHRRLAIIDLSEAGAQPMVDAESGCAITFNGEIYNFRELRRELEALGATFRSSSDTEVILKAYNRWGVEAVARFRGIFAFALWDPRAQCTYLVRDPLGIKPLYWTTVRIPGSGEKVTLFASEVRALLASCAVGRRLSPAAVATYLWHGFVVGPGSIVEGVELLAAGSILTIGAGDPSVRRQQRYWSLPPSWRQRTSVEDLRDELRRTVRMQLVSDVPLGVFLSGGVDSSAVAALVSEVAPESVHTFTIGFEAAAYDESRYARLVADAIGSRHTNAVLTEERFQEQLAAAFASIDQPTFDGINTYFVSRAAREAGMTVALAGTGGDELFGGYQSYVDIPRALRFANRLPFRASEGRAGEALVRAADIAARLWGGAFWRLLGMAPPQTRWGKLADLAPAIQDPLGLYQVSYALFTGETQERLAVEAVREAQGAQVFGLPAPVAADWRGRLEGSELRHAVSVLELSSFIGERLLRDTDSASMAVALEVRVPLLDHVLAEVIAGLDPDVRFSPPRKKQLLRETALGGLDPAIFQRPKSGFVLPIDTWARQRLQPQMEELFRDAALIRRAGLRPAAVHTLWRSFVARRPGLYWSRVWALYVLLSWCREHEVFLS